MAGFETGKLDTLNVLHDNVDLPLVLKCAIHLGNWDSGVLGDKAHRRCFGE
jgi:hypothetical protein